MKCRTGLRFGKQSADQSAQNGTTDAQEGGHYETELLRARHDGPSDQTDDETDDDGPNNV